MLAAKLIIPARNGLTDIGVNVISVFLGTVFLWMTEGIGWTSLLAIGMLGTTGVMSYSQIAQNSFGNWVTIYTIVSSILNYSLMEAGIIDRIVKWFVTRRFLRGKPWLFIATWLFAIYVVSLVMNSTSVALVILPMVTALCAEIGSQKGDKLPKILLMGSVISILLGYNATPISHSIPVTFLGLVNRDFNVQLTFFDWCKVGVPVSLLMFAVMILFFRIVMRTDVSSVEQVDVEAMRNSIQPMTAKQKTISITYLIVIFVWLMPTIFQNILPELAARVNGIGYSVPVIIAVVILNAIKDRDGQSYMNFDAAVKSVSWPLIILTAAIMLMNPCMSAETAGINVFLTNTLGAAFQSSASKWLIVLIAAAWVVIQTNFMSCNVSGHLVYTIMTPLALLAPHLGLSAVSLGIMIAYGCDIAFLTPPACGPAAVFLSTDYFTPKDAMRYGAPIVAIYILICAFVMYPLGVMLL